MAFSRYYQSSLIETWSKCHAGVHQIGFKGWRLSLASEVSNLGIRNGAFLPWNKDSKTEPSSFALLLKGLCFSVDSDWVLEKRLIWSDGADLENCRERLSLVTFAIMFGVDWRKNSDLIQAQFMLGGDPEEQILFIKYWPFYYINNSVLSE